jgi:hypothetical protein
MTKKSHTGTTDTTSEVDLEEGKIITTGTETKQINFPRDGGIPLNTNLECRQVGAAAFLDDISS